ncbi:putative inorganic phosphate cotransporter isoform X2 [Stegodyphus dumicola]|uniref:putative inorganic phosphate cotransporter isoform X2 n=1 Tax=Stegodyphus dumicola TaxID=202533 RepID=UPI0015AA7920|nr:putative inorganic phosphate cotransporter isoform X2 [Stegodyphus dumicola]
MTLLNIWRIIHSSKQIYQIRASRVTKQHEISQKSGGSKSPCLQCRYLVAILGFFVYCLLNILRVNMSIGIVAMVNVSGILGIEDLNPENLTLCPLDSNSSKDLITTEGLLQSATCILMASWFPRTERGFLSTFILSGLCLGAVVGGLLTGVLCNSTFLGGWPSAFYVFGGLGILLTLILIIFLYETPATDPRISNEELKHISGNQEQEIPYKRPPTPWLKLLTSVPVYALVFGMFGQVWSGVHFLSIHPTYLGKILHLPIAENGFFATAPFVLQAIFSLLGSSFSDWLNRKEYVGVDKVRKSCNLIACLGYSVCVWGIYFTGCRRTVNIAFSVLAMSFIGFGLAGSMIVPVDMSPTFAGTLMGIGGTISNTAGFILPVLTGFLTKNGQTTEQWNKVFLISVIVVLSSGIFFFFFGSAEIQPWNFSSEELSKCNTVTCKKETNLERKENDFNSDIINHI